MARRLSELERRFAEAYVGEARGNATEAARLAGYKGGDKQLAKQGYVLVRRERVTKAIEELRAPRTEAAYVTRDECRALLSSIIRGEATEQRVTPTGAVVEVGPSFVERRKSISEMARLEGWSEAGASGAARGPINVFVSVGAADVMAVDLAAHIPPEHDDDEVVVLPDNGRMLTQ